MSDNPYDVLGLEPDATSEDVNAAYKAAAKQAHPDAGGSTEAFTRVKSAAMVLLDPKRRKQFDDTGTLDAEKPDNSVAEVMEAIANFFISSLDALDAPMAPTLSQVNLVTAARQHFTNQIGGARAHIKNIEKKADKYDKALARLKSKRQNDVIRNMLAHHTSKTRQLVEITRGQIKQCEMAIEILKDYEFEEDKRPDPTIETYNRLFKGYGA